MLNTPIMYADDTNLLSRPTLDDFNGNQKTNPNNSIQINAELTKVLDWLTVNKLSLKKYDFFVVNKRY